MSIRESLLKHGDTIKQKSLLVDIANFIEFGVDHIGNGAYLNKKKLFICSSCWEGEGIQKIAKHWVEIKHKDDNVEECLYLCETHNEDVEEDNEDIEIIDCKFTDNSFNREDYYENQHN